MITGRVEESLEAVIPLSITDVSGQQCDLEAVIDTGFNGFLTLPPSLIARLETPLIGLGRAILADGEEKLFPLYEVMVHWDGQARTVEVDAADTGALVGMAMMEGYDLHIEVKDQGMVSIQNPPPG